MWTKSFIALYESFTFGLVDYSSNIIIPKCKYNTSVASINGQLFTYPIIHTCTMSERTNIKGKRCMQCNVKTFAHPKCQLRIRFTCTRVAWYLLCIFVTSCCKCISKWNGYRLYVLKEGTRSGPNRPAVAIGDPFSEVRLAVFACFGQIRKEKDTFLGMFF